MMVMIVVIVVTGMPGVIVVMVVIVVIVVIVVMVAVVMSSVAELMHWPLLRSGNFSQAICSGRRTRIKCDFNLP